MADESVRDVLAEMRAAIERNGSLTALPIEVVDRIEAALARERTQERVAFEKAARAYCQHLEKYPDAYKATDAQEHSLGIKWRVMRDAYRSHIAKESERA